LNAVQNRAVLALDILPMLEEEAEKRRKAKGQCWKSKLPACQTGKVFYIAGKQRPANLPNVMQKTGCNNAVHLYNSYGCFFCVLNCSKANCKRITRFFKVSNQKLK